MFNCKLCNVPCFDGKHEYCCSHHIERFVETKMCDSCYWKHSCARCGDELPYSGDMQTCRACDEKMRA